MVQILCEGVVATQYRAYTWACDTGFIVSRGSLGSSKMLTLGRVGGMVASKFVYL